MFQLFISECVSKRMNWSLEKIKLSSYAFELEEGEWGGLTSMELISL